LLIPAKYEPLKGHWSLPGGTVEVGEPLERRLTREMLEETGLVRGRWSRHRGVRRSCATSSTGSAINFVLVDYLCWPSGGTLYAGSDVDAAILGGSVGARRVFVDRKASSVIQRGLTLAREAPRPVR